MTYSEAYLEAYREAYLEGYRIGYLKGRYEERKNNVCSMLEVFSPEEVAALLKLPLAEVQAIADARIMERFV